MYLVSRALFDPFHADLMESAKPDFFKFHHTFFCPKTTAQLFRGIACPTLTLLSFHFTKEAAMSCPRCTGLMVSVTLEDRESTYVKYPALKCVTCGNVVDPLIARHRLDGQPVYRR
jgi:hypothetical protein